MSRRIGSHDVTLTVADCRAALREKLFRIVRSVPAPVTEAAGSGAPGKLRESHSCTLLLDPGVEDLNVEELVTTIRMRYPKLSIVVIERNDSLRHLPCEFGDGPLRTSSTPESPIARATAASHWAVLRASDRTDLYGGGERRSDSNEGPVCAAREDRD